MGPLVLWATPGATGPMFDVPFLSYDVGGSPWTQTAADFNGDGHVDVATVNRTQNSVTIRLNLGDGMLGERREVPVSVTNPKTIVAGDVNRDGPVDLIVSNDQASTVLLYGIGDGSFGTPNPLAVECPFGNRLADLNKDGWLDLVVLTFCNYIKVFLGSASGFAPLPQLNTAGDTPVDVALADLNHDNRLDAVTANQESNDLSVLLGNGDGTFATQIRLPTRQHPSGVAVADLDEDGNPDIASIELGPAVQPEGVGPTLSFFHGLGNGQFSSPQAQLTNFYNRAPALADLDQDGHMDLIAWPTVALGLGDGIFGNFVDYPSPGGSAAGLNQFAIRPDVIDLDEDGKPDLVVAVRGSNAIATHFGKGDGTFGITRQVQAALAVRTLALADLNSDGRLDVAAAATMDHVEFSAPAAVVLLGDGMAGWGPSVEYAASGTPFTIAVGDVNQDGPIDLMTANQTSNNVSLFRGLGNGSFQTAISIPAGASPRGAQLLDLDGDGDLDLVVTNSTNATVSVLRGDGQGGFSGPQSFPTGTSPYRVAVGDLDHDARPELVTANYDANTITVLHNLGNGTFQPDPSLPSGMHPADVLVGDVDGDGHNDVVTADTQSGTVSVFLGLGNRTFLPRQSFSVGPSPTGVVLEDFDLDGHSDLAVAITGRVSVLRGRGDGTFETQVLYSAGSAPFALAVGDVDLDGRRDLVVGGLFGAITVMLNSVPGAVVSVPFTLMELHSEPHLVRLLWQAPNAPLLGATVQRRTPQSNWIALGAATIEGGDGLRFEDDEVEPGARYAYRLAYRSDGQERFTPENWVEVPRVARLSLTGPRPNPAVNVMDVSFTLEGDDPATIEILDLAGRRLLSRAVGSLGTGSHRLRWDETRRLSEGVYWLRLSQGGRFRIAKAVFTR